MRDIAGLYVYDNTLVVLDVTGQQLLEALEHSARFFVAFVPGKTPDELVDERIPDYNFDVAEGVTYDIDIARPVGQRIRNLRFQGAARQPDAEIPPRDQQLPRQRRRRLRDVSRRPRALPFAARRFAT